MRRLSGSRPAGFVAAGRLPRGIGVTRLCDMPPEWMRQHEALGLTLPRAEAELWHIDAIAYRIERIRQGKAKRMIVLLPPRYLKSLLISVALPAFVLGHDPTLKIIVASYSDELATKHHNDCRLS
jgi:hypothetical protein